MILYDNAERGAVLQQKLDAASVAVGVLDIINFPSLRPNHSLH